MEVLKYRILVLKPHASAKIWNESNKGMASLEAFTCFYFLTKLSSNVFLMGN